MNKWYAVSIASNNELLATLNLKKQNFEIYYPKYKKIIRHARKVSTVLRPLFPGYLFVNLDIEKENWSKINSTYGVKNLITMGTRPVSISRDIINSLKAREDSNGITNIITDLPYDKGDRILINDGPFRGHRGIFDGLSDDNRIKVLFNILGRKIEVAFSAMSTSR